MVLSKRESDPVVSVTMTFLLDSLDVALFLEHFGILGHILW